jgi:hypothetical protein
MTQAGLIGLPVLLLAEDDPHVNYVVHILLVFVMNVALLLFIFWPKVGYYYMRKNRTALDASRNRSAQQRVPYRDSHSGLDAFVRSSSLRGFSLHDRGSNDNPSASGNVFGRSATPEEDVGFPSDDDAECLQQQQQTMLASDVASIRVLAMQAELRSKELTVEQCSGHSSDESKVADLEWAGGSD